MFTSESVNVNSIIRIRVRTSIADGMRASASMHIRIKSDTGSSIARHSRSVFVFV